MLEVIKHKLNINSNKTVNNLLHFSNNSCWPDMFAKNIYKSLLREGNVIVYPIPFEECKKQIINTKLFWIDNKFNRVIHEWENQLPHFQFISVGAYLCFYLGIFFDNIDLCLSTINGTSNEIIREVYNSQIKTEEWNDLELFLYINILDTLGIDNA